jgi:RNA polymerase sigma-70 factor (ECF subfamily)
MSTGLDLVKLIMTHQAGVWRYLRMLGCEPAEADELTQETFLAVMQRPFDDYHPTATAAYLRTVARNLFISAERRAARGLAPVQMSALELDAVDRAWTRLGTSRWGTDPDGAQDGFSRMLEALRACLESLTDRARQALDLRFRDKASRASIAASLGLSEDGAKNLLQRSKEQLRVCIERKMQ